MYYSYIPSQHQQVKHCKAPSNNNDVGIISNEHLFDNIFSMTELLKECHVWYLCYMTGFGVCIYAHPWYVSNVSVTQCMQQKTRCSS